MAAKEEFNITAEGCVATGARRGENFRLAVSIKGVSLKRAAMLGALETAVAKGKNGKTMAPEILVKLKEGISNATGGDDRVNFTSFGPLNGKYS